MITRLILLVPVALAAPRLHCQQVAAPTAEAIMARVAANQDNAEEARRHYVYIQHAKVISRKGHTVMCEETTDSRIAPTEKAYHAELVKLDGRLLHKGKYVAYTEQPVRQNGRSSDAPKPAQPDQGTSGVAAESETKDINVTLGDDDMDRDLVENIRGNLTRDDKSRDGIDTRLFPLTSKAQADYLFHLAGQEHLNAHEVFHIAFYPRDKSDYGWKGDAYIDTHSFQPVLVRTAMSKKVPFAVRTLMGTNVPGLGFNIVYAPQPDGVWFPVNFGTEFKIRLLFFFSRDITINAENRAFEKTHVDSKVIIPEVAAAP